MKALLIAATATGLFLVPADWAGAACVGGAENGIVEGGESCDDGPSNPCCTAACTANSAMNGAACDDYSDCSRASSCNKTGQCVGRQSNDGGPCFLRDGAGARFDCKTRTCEGLQCTGAVTFDPCSDGNVCTYDNGTYDENAPNQCVCGSNVPLADNALCDTDTSACTVERCLSGTCTYQSTIVCTPPSNECRRRRCVPETGSCVLEDKPNGTLCSSDGKICTYDECKGGDCKHLWAQSGDGCTDNKYCTTNDGCYAASPWTGQSTSNQLDCFGNPFELYQQPCNDGNTCSLTSWCDNTGTCVAATCATSGTCSTCQQACNDSTSTCNCFTGANAAP